MFRKKSGSRTTLPQADFEALWAPNGEYFNALLKANQALASGMASLGQEVLTFAGMRMRRSFEVSETLLNCKDFNEVFRIQIQHTQAANAQYLEEANKLLILAGQVHHSCWAPLEADTKEAAEAPPGERPVQ